MKKHPIYWGRVFTLSVLISFIFLFITRLSFASQHTMFPEEINYKEGERVSYSDINILMHQLGMSENLTFKLRNANVDKAGYSHYRFQQYYMGYEIEYASWSVHVLNGKIHYMNGSAMKTFELKNLNPALTENQARQAAIDYVGASVYFWDLDSIAIANKINAEDLMQYYPGGELIIATNVNKLPQLDYQLCYKFLVSAKVPFSIKNICVDVTTGAIQNDEPVGNPYDGESNLRLINKVQFNNQTSPCTNTCGNAVTNLYGCKSINTKYSSSLQAYTLFDAINHINVLDQQYLIPLLYDFTDSDDCWDASSFASNPYPNGLHRVLDAFYAAKVFNEMLWNKFGRNGLDDLGIGTRILFNSAFIQYGAAYYSANGGLSPFVAVGELVYNTTKFVTLDIIGHEYGHGVVDYTADLISTGEPAAVNEGFADIFGVYLEKYEATSPFEWVNGEDLPMQQAAAGPRHLDYPTRAACPESYGLEYYDGSMSDPHINSGVVAHCFYLLSEGSNCVKNNRNYNIQGIGIEKAMQIFYNALFYMHSTDDFNRTFKNIVHSAEILYGICSPEYLAAAQAVDYCGYGSFLINSSTSIYMTNYNTVRDEVSNIELCSGEAVDLCICLDSYIGNYNWLMNGHAISSNVSCITVTTPGIYKVELQGICGSSVYSNTVTATQQSSATIDPGGPVYLCNGPVDLEVLNTNGYQIAWYQNGLPISGATSSIYTVTIPGNYSVELTSLQYNAQAISMNTPMSWSGLAAGCDLIATSDISVSGYVGNIKTGDIRLEVQFVHPNPTEVGMYLETPNGEILGLFPNWNWSPNTLNPHTVNHMIFTDGSIYNLYNNPSPYVPASVTPWHQPFLLECIGTTFWRFADLNNGYMNPNGTWKLHFMDNDGGNAGSSLTSWTLHLPSYTVPQKSCAPIQVGTVRVFDCPPRIAGNNLQDMRVMPNPTTDYSICTFTSEEAGNYRIELLDFAGRLLHYSDFTSKGTGENFSEELNLSTYDRGVYNIRLIKNDKQINIQKLILN